MKASAALAAVIGGIIILFAASGKLPAPEPPAPEPPEKADVLTQAYSADRTGRIAILRELDTREFDNDQQKADWHNEQTDALRATAFKPYIDALAQHLVDGTVAQFADELQGSTK